MNKANIKNDYIWLCYLQAGSALNKVLQIDMLKNLVSATAFFQVNTVTESQNLGIWN